MRVLFVLSRSLFPHFRSGADVANHEYLAALVARGISCTALGCRPGEPVRLEQDGVSVELVDGPQALLDRTVMALRDERPDVLLTGCAGNGDDQRFEELLLEACGLFGVPAALLVRDIGETFQAYQGLAERFSLLVTNSQFTAQEVRTRWQLPAEVVYSVPDRARVVKASSGQDRPFLTMFNPIAPKGLKVVLALAGVYLPHRRYQLVEGWMPFDALGIPKEKFPALSIAPRTLDVASIYASTDCVLVPSLVPEGFGRVAVEGLFNHRPVLGSASGGLIEILADSPLLVQEKENPEAWAYLLRCLEHPVFHAEAVAWSARRALAFDREREMDHLAYLLRRLAGRLPAAAPKTLPRLPITSSTIPC